MITVLPTPLPNVILILTSNFHLSINISVKTWENWKVLKVFPSLSSWLVWGWGFSSRKCPFVYSLMPILLKCGFYILLLSSSLWQYNLTDVTQGRKGWFWLLVTGDTVHPSWQGSWCGSICSSRSVRQQLAPHHISQIRQVADSLV